MTKYLLLLALCILSLLQITFQAITIPLAKASLPTVTPTPQTTAEPDIPGLVKELYLGVPAGNGYRPSRIVVDSRRHRVYTLNKGFDDAGRS